MTSKAIVVALTLAVLIAGCLGMIGHATGMNTASPHPFGTVPGAPTGLHVIYVTGKMLEFAWTAPTGGGITNYTLYIGPICSARLGYSSFGGTTLSITGRSPSTVYCVEVTAWNLTGESRGIWGNFSTTPFIAAESGSGTIAISTVAGNSLILFTDSNAPSDSQTNIWNPVATSAGMSIYNTTTGVTGTDSIIIGGYGFAFQVQASPLDQILAYGTDLTTTVASALPVRSVAVISGLAVPAPCSASGGSAWNVSAYVEAGNAACVSGWSQNVSTGVSPTLSMNGTYFGSGSQYAAWVEIAAQGVPPPGAPSMVWANTTGADSINVSWVADPGLIINYTVEYGVYGGPLGNLTSAGTTIYLIVYGLATDTEYTFKVAAWTSGGMSPWSVPVSNTTALSGGGPAPAVNASGGIMLVAMLGVVLAGVVIASARRKGD